MTELWRCVQIKELVEDICKVRMSKICAGLQVLQGPMTVKLNNLSAMECNIVRPFFQGSLAQFQALAGVGSLETSVILSSDSQRESLQSLKIMSQMKSRQAPFDDLCAVQTPLQPQL